MEYEGTYIYVMQFQYIFQYLFSWKNEIYQDRVFLFPPLWRRVFWRLGLISTPYTKEMISDAEQVILSGAMASIDALREMKKSNRVIEKKKAEVKNTIEEMGLVAKPLPVEK